MDQRVFIGETRQKCPKVAVETGTLLGETTADLVKRFVTVHSIELSEKLYDLACKNPELEAAHLHWGNSANLLPELCEEIQEPVFFLLDAHYCLDHPEAAGGEFPLWRELEAIAEREWDDVVLVDDYRTWGEHRPTLKRGGQSESWSSVSTGSIMKKLRRVQGVVVNSEAGVVKSLAFKLCGGVR